MTVKALRVIVKAHDIIRPHTVLYNGTAHYNDLRKQIFGSTVNKETGQWQV